MSKTGKNLIKPDIQEDPYTKITFEDGQVLNLKTEKLEYDYMAYIVVRELAERAMIAQSSYSPSRYWVLFCPDKASSIFLYFLA